MDLMVGRRKREVFMSSIGQPIKEYLVNFNFFIDIMKAMDLNYIIYLNLIKVNITL